MGEDAAGGAAAVTFLFSDIEGSTRLWEQRTAEMAAALARHDALALAAVQRHGGHFVKTTGDGIHAAFEDPAAAVAAVLDLQLGLADEEARQVTAAAAGTAPASAPLALHVRCGLHRGVVERRGGDYYGPAVNRAARIMSIAHGGQTLLSMALAEQVVGRLPAGAGLRELGRVRLRDLAEPEAVLQLVHPRLREHFPALRSLEATPNNLAQQLDSFVGREAELAAARELLSRTRLLTLLGMGGLGKSRLSVQLGAELLPEFPDGVWLVELAPLTDARSLPQALASVLGLREEPGQTLLQSLSRHVRERQLLFILDNCEHLLDAAAALAKQLLQAGAGVKVLATSRSALQIAGESAYPLQPLAVPEPGGRGEPAELLRHESVRLFVERATAAVAGFRLDARNAAAVAEICRRLDGIPLALELAAARVRVLAPAAIVARLEDRFRLLQTADRTVLPRQRTLRALIDWSHDLLSPPEQRLLRRLSVFAGGWTLDAAEVVCADAELDAAEVLELQSRLVQESLVALLPGGERYRMLDTVRAYAAEKLGAGDEAQALAQRHLAWCVRLAEQAYPQLAGPGQGAWLARLDLERENLMSAHQASARLADGDGQALRLAHALRSYFVTRGSPSAGLALALDTLERPGLRPRDAARCKALFGAGQLSWLMGRHAEAGRLLGECLEVAREIGDERVLARVLQPLGMNSLALGDFAAARVHLGEAVERARLQGAPRELMSAYSALAMLHRMEGALEVAAPLCTQAIALARELGDAESLGISLVNAAMVAIGRQRAEESPAMLQEACALAAATGSLPLRIGVAEVIAGLAAASRQAAAAATFFGAAQAQRQASGLARDAVDEQFLRDVLQPARDALGPVAWAAAQSAGEGSAGVELLPTLQTWLLSRRPS